MTVRRDHAADIRIRNLELWIDGAFVTDLAWGESWNGDLSAGEHDVRVTNRLKSESLRVPHDATLSAGNVVGAVGGAMIAVLGIGPYGVALSRVS